MKNDKMSMPLKILGIFLLSGITAATAQETMIAKITVDPTSHNYVNTPVSADLSGINYQKEARLKLQEIKGSERLDVPVQIEEGFSRRIWWVLSDTTKAGDKRVYELVQREEEPSLATVQATPDETSLKISLRGQEILQYQHAIMPPPDGANTLFARSAFIHPLKSPSGIVLTRIHAPDHIHHMGIWNPWTKTKFEGREIDFWNLNKGEGTVRFANFSSIISGQVYGGFQAIQNHVDLKAPGGEKVALNEQWDIRVWNGRNDQIPGPQQAYLMDFTSTLNCASTSPITLEEYRYAGFGFRATQEWHKDNSGILTSEGKNRLDADATTARWCNVFGETADGQAGILFMSHPANYNHPEPMRIWPEDMNGRGDVFFQFSPTRDKDWELMPGNDYTLKYRMYVYDGAITADQAEQIWQDYAHPPAIEISIDNQ